MFRNWASDPEVTKFLTWPAHGDVSVTRHVLVLWRAQEQNTDPALSLPDEPGFPGQTLLNSSYLSFLQPNAAQRMPFPMLKQLYKFEKQKGGQ